MRWRRRELKADVAFEMFRLLDVPFFTFHDSRHRAGRRDARRDRNRNLDAIADIFARKMAEAKVKLLWGTANLFSTAATWRAPRPIPTRSLRLCRRRR